MEKRKKLAPFLRSVQFLIKKKKTKQKKADSNTLVLFLQLVIKKTDSIN